MKILIACEFSGIVRDAFLLQGHDVVSCDLLPSETPGPHYTGDVADLLGGRWDMMIAHPPCTYLCNSGVRWLSSDPGRWQKMYSACQFFLSLLNADIPRICVENPIMHKYSREVIGIKYTQIIRPWQFGHGEQKATCLWLKGLPLLEPTDVIQDPAKRRGNLTCSEQNKLPPSADRWKLRSMTYPGIAAAMSEQWG